MRELERNTYLLAASGAILSLGIGATCVTGNKYIKAATTVASIATVGMIGYSIYRNSVTTSSHMEDFNDYYNQNLKQLEDRLLNQQMAIQKMAKNYIEDTSTEVEENFDV